MNIQALAMEALPYNSAVLMRKVDTPCHSCGVHLTVGATTRRWCSKIPHPGGREGGTSE
jgi:hypothetical protein